MYSFKSSLAAVMDNRAHSQFYGFNVQSGSIHLNEYSVSGKDTTYHMDYKNTPDTCRISVSDYDLDLDARSFELADEPIKSDATSTPEAKVTFTRR